MSAPRCNVVLVGAGHLGHHHLRKVLASRNATLVGVVEPDGERRARALATVAQALGPTRAQAVAAAATLADLQLAAPAAPQLAGAATAAIVATPTVHHVACALACLARGWDVLVEKPLAPTAAQAAALVAAAGRTGRLLQVGHLERYNPAVQAVLPALRQARFVTCERLSPFSGRSTDVDVVLDLMVHDLDLMACALGPDVTEVRAVGVQVLTHSVDMASARLVFASGAVAQLSAGRASLEAQRKLRFFTADRYVSVDCLMRTVKAVRRLPAEAGDAWPQISGEPWPVAEGDALAAQDEAFFAAVATRRRPWVDGEAGLQALRLAEAVKAAFQPFGAPAGAAQARTACQPSASVAAQAPQLST